MKPVIVLTTTPDLACAQKMSSEIVNAKLAACVQISAPVRSVYIWKGKIESADEFQLWIKTTASLFDKLSKKIQELHPYEVPEILSIPIDAISPKYLEWLKSETAR